MLGGVFSILAGFINQMIIAAYFGAGAEMDAYFTALVIPAYFQVVLITGLSFVFIPAFVREETKGNEDAAWELVGTFFGLPQRS
jgi:peptidoglycan biosynthesis protein MviN/MurJ (putative lipid II flippase)